MWATTATTARTGWRHADRCGGAGQGRGPCRPRRDHPAVVGRLEAREVRLSYHPDNKAAARLYAEAGFRPTGDTEDDEIVVALRP